MDLKNLVNTYDQGKQFFELFKELETPPESYFVWPMTKTLPSVPVKRKNLFIMKSQAIVYPAFLGGELDILLPSLVYFPPLCPQKNSAERAGRLQMSKSYGNKCEWLVGYFQDWDWAKPLITNQSATPACTKATLLIRMMKEEKLIKAEDLKL